MIGMISLTGMLQKKVLIPGVDEIDTFVGYLKGTLELIDASVLHFMEFIEIKNDSVTLVKYKYQWQFETGDLITRWDNVPHHREIATFPHHNKIITISLT